MIFVVCILSPNKLKSP